MTKGLNSTGEQPRGARVVEFDSALWRQLLSRGDRQAFFESWIALQARQLPGVLSGVLITMQEDGQLRPTAYWPKGGSPGRDLMKCVQSAVHRKIGVVRRVDGAPEDKPVSAFAYPIILGGEVVAAAGFNVAGAIETDLQAALRRVQWGAIWLENHFREDRGDVVQDTAGRLATTLDLVAVSLDHSEADAAAIALMTEMAIRVGAERASIGFLRGSRMQVKAISHNSDVSRRQNLVRAIGEAMDEAIDQGMLVVYPTFEGEHVVTRAHEALSRRMGAGGPVMSIPLERDGLPFGAITIEYPAERELDPADVDFAQATAVLAGHVLRIRAREERPLIAKTAEVSRRQLGRLLGPGYLGRKIVFLTIAALTVLFYFWHGAFTLPARAALEGSVQRVVTAPYDGYIAEEHARPGDLVEEGTVLARLDDRELQLELAAWRSRRAQYEAERQSALASRDIARARVFEAQIEEADVQIALVERKIGLGTIRAPFEGIVLSGDLSQGLGSSVRLGDALFQLAPLSSYRVALSIYEDDMHELAVGRTGRLVLAARPDEALDFTVTKITSVTEPIEGRNTFRVEARLDAPPAELRPGMKGVAKVDAGQRRVIWIWTRRAVNWLRVELWKWLP